MPKTWQKLSGEGRRRATPGNGQNIWDRGQREVMFTLYTRFQTTIAEKTKIFNAIFADHLSSCGLPNGLNANAFSSQYGERNKTWPPDIGQRATDSGEIAKRRAIYERISRLTAAPQPNTPRPIGSFAEPATLPFLSSAAAVKRHRSLSTVGSVDSRDRDTEASQAKRLKSKHSTAVVVIPQQEQDAAVRSQRSAGTTTPRKKSVGSRTPSSRRTDATVQYDLPSGTTIWLTPEQYRETQADLVPLDEAVAHPNIPLLFRYSSPNCQSPLTDDGFCAGRFATTIIPAPSPPSLSNFPWSCAAQHLNRDPKIASPFISTSNNFVWIIRLALKEAERGAVGGRISLVDPSMLDRRAIFHAQPIHRELCKKRPFDNGAFLYHGMNEFLVWAKIKKEAVISTFPVDMLFDLSRTNPGIGALLRLEQLRMPRTGYYSTILPALKAQNMILQRASINAIAGVCRAMGLDVSMVEAVSSLVSDIIKYYGLVLHHKSPEQWRVVASIFGEAMCAQQASAATLVNVQNMRFAFLDGCRWAVGDFNARQKPKHMATMLGRAKKIGLDSPAGILTSDLDAARLSIVAYETKQQALLRGSASRALLAEPDEFEDQIVHNPRRRTKRITYDLEDSNTPGADQEEDIVYDVDEDYDGSIYEL